MLSFAKITLVSNVGQATESTYKAQENKEDLGIIQQDCQ
jgi:hypothetical protein